MTKKWILTKLILILTSLSLPAQAQGQGVNAMVTAEDVIRRLELKPLPEEGGFYRETYRSNVFVQSHSGDPIPNGRVASTAIFYLVTPEDYSALHRITSDEVFHFYAGDPVEMTQVDQNRGLMRITMGSDFMNGNQLQVVVPQGVWQSLRLKEGGKWALLGTTVAPGFEFADFEVASRDQIVEMFPNHCEVLMKDIRY